MAAGNLNLGKASGGVLNIQPADGTTNTSVVLPDRGTLVSDTTLKTINGSSLVGTGNLTTVDLTTNQSIDGIKTFTSSPTAPTPTAEDNSTKIATTAFVLANRLFKAGNKLEAQANNEVNAINSTYTKKKEILVSTGGTITVSFRLRTISESTSYAVYGQIYVNNVAVGTVRTNISLSYITYTENITIAAGDLVQLYLKGGPYVNASNPVYADTFKILVAEPSTSTVLLN